MAPLHVVTVDGPAGSGKTACGRMVALRLDLAFISSGLYYRALTFAVVREGIPFTRQEEVAALAAAIDVELHNDTEGVRVSVNGADVTGSLKDPAVTDRVRYVAENPLAREALGSRMRQGLGAGGTVAEGRDMGSVVFPDARWKFFLEADLECRVRRRARELEGLGQHVDVAALRDAIRARDARDRGRAIAPLVVPDGAVVIDTSALGIDEVVARIIRETGIRTPGHA